MQMQEEIPLLTGIAEAVVHAGGQKQLADALGVTQQAVSSWMSRGYAPFSRVAEIESQFGVHRARLANPRYLSAFSPVHFTNET